MATESGSKYCQICGRNHPLKEFYSSNNLEKYPDGKLNICKKQLTMEVDNWDPNTFLGILQECDVPYIPKIWNNKLATFGKDRSKVSGVTIIGRYLSTMKIKPNDKWRWKDTQYLQEVEDKAIEESMLRQGFDMVEIDKVIRNNNKTVPKEGQEFEIKLNDDYTRFLNGEPPPPPCESFDTNSSSLGDVYIPEGPSTFVEEDTSITDSLTEEDKTYLRLKWGKSYRAEEWVKLEQQFQEMKEAYTVEGPGHEDILKLACKTSLKANKLIDVDDVEGAQKMLKMYESMMKSGNFTAAQNKAEKGEYLNSISELAALCEQEGFVTKFYITKPNDKVDETLFDMQRYTHDLVVNEMNLGTLLESAIKQMAMEEAKEEDEDTDDDLSFEELDAIKDEDFSEYKDFIEEQEMSDEEYIKKYMQGDKK